MVILPDDRVLGARIYGLGGLGYGADGRIYMPGDVPFGPGGLYAGPDGRGYGPALGPSGKLFGPGGVVLPSDGLAGNGLDAMPPPFLPAPGYSMGQMNLPAPGYGMEPYRFAPTFPTPGYRPDIATIRPNFPTPGYTPNLPSVGYAPPPEVHKPAQFGVNPFVRSPRDFFMWGDMVDDQARREKRPGLVQ
jgi:hypothetical protein